MLSSVLKWDGLGDFGGEEMCKNVMIESSCCSGYNTCIAPPPSQIQSPNKALTANFR